MNENANQQNPITPTPEAGRLITEADALEMFQEDWEQDFDKGTEPPDDTY